jgi:hypothetical protein
MRNSSKETSNGIKRHLIVVSGRDLPGGVVESLGNGSGGAGGVESSNFLSTPTLSSLSIGSASNSSGSSVTDEPWSIDSMLFEDFGLGSMTFDGDIWEKDEDVIEVVKGGPKDEKEKENDEPWRVGWKEVGDKMREGKIELSTVSCGWLPKLEGWWKAVSDV